MKIEIITGSDNNPVAEYFSSSRTPETDAVLRRLVENQSGNSCDAVLIHHARKLERERDDARDRYVKLLTENMLEVHKLYRYGEKLMLLLQKTLPFIDMGFEADAFKRLHNEATDIYDEIKNTINDDKARRNCD